jgi:energy-coupling factor transporter transmembrane protein EcfT
MGWALSAPLAGAKFKWDYVRKVYIAMVVAITALVVLIGAYKFVFGEAISAETIRLALQGGLGMLLMGAVFLLILGAIPKMPARKLMQWTGAIALFVVICLAFFWPMAKRELVAKCDEPSPKESQQLFVQPPPPARTETASGEILIPIRPDRLSGPFRSGYSMHVCYDTGDNIRAREIKVHDATTGQFLYPLSEINGTELVRGVRFSGPESVLLVRWKKFS